MPIENWSCCMIHALARTATLSDYFEKAAHQNRSPAAWIAVQEQATFGPQVMKLSILTGIGLAPKCRQSQISVREFGLEEGTGERDALTSGRFGHGELTLRVSWETEFGNKRDGSVATSALPRTHLNERGSRLSIDPLAFQRFPPIASRSAIIPVGI